MKGHLKRRIFSTWLFGAWSIGHVKAQPVWPVKPVTLVVPFPAGGSSDVTARVLAPTLSEVIRQSVIVENIIGAGGVIGVRKVLRALPDGHVLLLGGISETLLIPLSTSGIDYVPEDLRAISFMGSTPVALVARASLPAISVDAFVDDARSASPSLIYGSTGLGSYSHLMFEALMQRAQIQLLHVPYKGSSQMLVDLQAGRIDVSLISLPAALAILNNGKIKILGVGAAEAPHALPDAGLFRESKYFSQIPEPLWGAVFGSHGLTDATVRSIQNAFEQVLQKPKVKTQLHQLGIQVNPPGMAAESKQKFQRLIQDFRKIVTSPPVQVLTPP